ncbi:MAG: polysaccharide deacetylase family protein [bacterium]|nr:polysaccharide deacetylase family protein [bacterium]
MYKSKLLGIVALMVIFSICFCVCYDLVFVKQENLIESDSASDSEAIESQVSSQIIPSSSLSPPSYVEVINSNPVESSSEPVSTETFKPVNSAPVSSSQPAPSVSKPVSPYVGGVQLKLNTGFKGRCYLTFDDGPSKNTAAILDVLRRYNAKATFFVVSSVNLGKVADIHNAGHAIGLHSDSHEYSSIYKGVNEFYSDLNAIRSKVAGYTGQDVRIIRFPGGSNNLVSLTQGKCPGLMTVLTSDVEKKGYRYFDWNVNSCDAEASMMVRINGKRMVPMETIVRSVIEGAESSNGSYKPDICVLMHDLGGKETTVQALPYIIDYLSKIGYTFSVLDENAPDFKYKKLNN